MKIKFAKNHFILIISNMILKMSVLNYFPLKEYFSLYLKQLRIISHTNNIIIIIS